MDFKLGFCQIKVTASGFEDKSKIRIKSVERMHLKALSYFGLNPISFKYEYKKKTDNNIEQIKYKPVFWV